MMLTEPGLHLLTGICLFGEKHIELSWEEFPYSGPRDIIQSSHNLQHTNATNKIPALGQYVGLQEVLFW